MLAVLELILTLISFLIVGALIALAFI